MSSISFSVSIRAGSCFEVVLSIRLLREPCAALGANVYVKDRGEPKTMTRSILAVLASAAAIAVLTGTGCQPGGVGDPCTPEAEYNPSFLGFDVKEVNTESESFQCLTRLCLVNHFQGRVSCPYGQQSDGTPRMGASSCSGANNSAAGCCVPGTSAPINGIDPTTEASRPTPNVGVRRCSLNVLTGPLTKLSTAPVGVRTQTGRRTTGPTIAPVPTGSRARSS